MAPLTPDDVGGLSVKEADGQIRERMRELASIRDKHDGTLAGIAAGDPDIERVGELNGNLTVLAERLDEARELEAGNAAFVKLSEFMNEVDPDNGHPGHSKIKPRGSQTRDLGGLFVESEAWRAYSETGALDKAVTLPIASLWANYRGIGEVPADGFALQATLFDSPDYPIQPEFIAQPVETLYQPNNIGPLMAQGTTNSNAIRYPVKTVVEHGRDGNRRGHREARGRAQLRADQRARPQDRRAATAHRRGARQRPVPAGLHQRTAAAVRADARGLAAPQRERHGAEHSRNPQPVRDQLGDHLLDRRREPRPSAALTACSRRPCGSAMRSSRPTRRS